MHRSAVQDWLEKDLSPLRRKLDAPSVHDLVERFQAWLHSDRPTDFGLTDEATPPRDELFDLLRFLQDEIRMHQTQYEFLRARQIEFDHRRAGAATDEERKEHILDFARDLGATRDQLRADTKAFARWFGADAVTERRARRQARAERSTAFCLERLGVLAAGMMKAAPDPAATWRRLGMEAHVRPLLTHPGDPRVVTAAFRCLSTALRSWPVGHAETAIDDATLAFIYRTALDPDGPTWVQCEAIELLGYLSAENFRRVLETRLKRPAKGDDIFVRRRAVQVLGAFLPNDPTPRPSPKGSEAVYDGLLPLLAVAAQDASPFVRQAAARAVVAAPSEDARALLRQLACDDSSREVRGAMLSEALALLARPEQFADLLAVLTDVLRSDQDPFVLRVACQVAAEGSSVLTTAHREFAGDWRDTVNVELERLHRCAASLAVRRWAAHARERIWCDGNPSARALRDALLPQLRKIKPGSRAHIPNALLRGHDEATIGRVLSVLAQDDFGYDLKWGWFGAWITRGHVFQFRAWRFLHEMTHSDPAKRQGFNHTVGRVSNADVRAPSSILAELAETKVPGEPLFLASEGGWRPYLPLPDDAISAAGQIVFARPVRFFTSEGMTELHPPRTPWGRAWAWWRLTRSFARFAQLRNWRENDPADPGDYLRELTKLGFRITITPYPSGAGQALQPDSQAGKPDLSLGAASEPTPAMDSAVERFFPASSAAALPAFVGPFLPEWIANLPGDFWIYFHSLYGNSLSDLVIFMVAGLLYFFGRHWYLNLTLQRARSRIALSLGGWGTRGKSGTERLKAGLISALGYGYVSKTTGCEAMILHAEPYGKTRELFLYRSYDKATIWEQREVIQIAAQLRAEVFLWECMGLNPNYVEILQRQWMHDDAATITNTYPDHEDIQGPAGINIPEVMTQFIPRGTRLVTSEEQMKPILADAAGRLGTQFRSVGWLEAGLLPSDVLSRFPYEEHPYNIALVLALADDLGIERDFALKEMADRVVPDLGVLKTTPQAPLRSRKLEFSNGMSANERHGCVTNWSRLGFDRCDPEAEPGVWVTTVVNNRADRIPRSRVFASVLVNDLCADRHILIGGNLSGLLTYIREAWDELTPKLTLWHEGSEPLEVVRAAAKRFRQPHSEEMVVKRLGAMLAGVSCGDGRPVSECNSIPLAELAAAADRLRECLITAKVNEDLTTEILAFLEQDRRALSEYQAFVARLRGADGNDRQELNRAFHQLLWTWFERKLVVVHDYHATGNQIIDTVCRQTPPGFRNRIMGIQNIKGTGLDFVYRWEAWIACHKACTLLRSDDSLTAERGLHELATFQDFGLVAEEYVRDTIALVRKKPLAQKESFQTQLDVVLANLEAKLVSVREQLQGGIKKAGWFDWMVGFVEAWLDPGDAIRRRRTSERIYRDLVDERISPDRAALELQALTSRQKGGWLRKRLQKIRQAFLG